MNLNTGIRNWRLAVKYNLLKYFLICYFMVFIENLNYEFYFLIIYFSTVKSIFGLKESDLEFYI